MIDVRELAILLASRSDTAPGGYRAQDVEDAAWIVEHRDQLLRILAPAQRPPARTIVWSQRERRAVYQSLRNMIDAFERDDQQLAARAAVNADGYGTGTSFDAMPTGPAEATSVERAVSLRIGAIETPSDASKAFILLHAAERALACADGQRQRALPPTERVAPPDVDHLWCTNHVRFKLFEPRYRGDLCRACYDWDAGHGGLPDLELCRHWASGRVQRRYTTTKDVAAWEAREAQRQGRHQKVS